MSNIFLLPPRLEQVVVRIGALAGWDRNYTLGVLNGWFCICGDAFLNGSVVYASFATALGAPNAVIGLLPAIQAGGWFLPQLVVASQVRHLPQKIVVYRAMSTLRALSGFAMVASSLVFAAQPAVLLVVFLLCLAVNAVAGGISGLPWMEVAAKIVPSEKRPGFFATRNLWGGLLGLLGGFLVAAVLASPIVFPFDYSLVFFLGMSLYVVGWQLYGHCDEPPDPPQPRSNVWQELQAIPVTVRQDPSFGAFLRYRVVAAIAGLAEPFFTSYALRVVGVPKPMLGVFLIVIGIAAPLSNWVWARLALRFGSRRSIRVSLVCALLGLALAATLGKGAGAWFAVVFAFSSVAQAGLNLGHANYLLSVALPAARSRYIGTVNTVVGVVVLAPILAGWLADVYGYALVFVLGAVLYAAAWVLAGSLRQDV